MTLCINAFSLSIPDLPPALTHYLNAIEECKDLPKTLTIYNHEAPSHAEASVSQEGKLIWLAFAFESVSSWVKRGGVYVCHLSVVCMHTERQRERESCVCVCDLQCLGERRMGQ